MNVNDFIVAGAEALIGNQHDDGSFPPGHNGPYHDQELPIRNTSHVLILMLKAYEISGMQKYRQSALKALSYIKNEDRRPMRATYWLRKKPEKDFSNGLIGQAWVFESLIYAADILEDESLLEIIEKIFLLHPFDNEKARWRIVNVDGSYAQVDMTFNHQLWFAAVGSYVKRNTEISGQIDRFMEKLDQNLEIHRNGLIMHELGGGENIRKPVKKKIKALVKNLLMRSRKPFYMDRRIHKAIGYHAFNTHGFSMLYTNRPTHSFWSSEKFKKILGFLQAEIYVNGLDRYKEDEKKGDSSVQWNQYGYPYNPSGIEVAYTLQTFPGDSGGSIETTVTEWLNRQMKITYDSAARLMCKNTDDKNTLTARMYEAVRLDNWEFQVDQ